MTTATTAPYTWDFELDKKSVTETATGDVIVSGYASTYDEDRMAEAFLPGCFEAGLRRFLDTNPQVLWMHQYDVPLGIVEDARLDKKGMWVRCRLDAPTPGSAAEDIVRRVLRGSLKAFSVGGRWSRKMTPQGMRIHTADVMEVSIASVPVNASALIDSVARKSFENATPTNHVTDFERLRNDAAELQAAIEKEKSVSNFWSRAATSPAPHESHAEAVYEPPPSRAEAIHAERRRSLHAAGRIDRTVETIYEGVDLNRALYGGDVTPGDIASEKLEDGGTISAEGLRLAYGLPPTLPPPRELSSTEVFDLQEREAARQARDEGLSSRMRERVAELYRLAEEKSQ